MRFNIAEGDTRQQHGNGKLAHEIERRVAAGKSTALAWLEETAGPDDRYDILVDGTLSDRATARAKIRRALALGRTVTVYVHREFAQTVLMVVKRAIEMGRAGAG